MPLLEVAEAALADVAALVVDGIEGGGRPPRDPRRVRWARVAVGSRHGSRSHADARGSCARSAPYRSGTASGRVRGRPAGRATRSLPGSGSSAGASPDWPGETAITKATRGRRRAGGASSTVRHRRGQPARQLCPCNSIQPMASSFVSSVTALSRRAAWATSCSAEDANSPLECPSLMIAYFGLSLDTKVSAISSHLQLYAAHPEQRRTLKGDPNVVLTPCGPGAAHGEHDARRLAATAHVPARRWSRATVARRTAGERRQLRHVVHRQPKEPFCTGRFATVSRFRRWVDCRGSCGRCFPVGSSLRTDVVGPGSTRTSPPEVRDLRI